MMKTPPPKRVFTYLLLFALPLASQLTSGCLAPATLRIYDVTGAHRPVTIRKMGYAHQLLQLSAQSEEFTTISGLPDRRRVLLSLWNMRGESLSHRFVEVFPPLWYVRGHRNLSLDGWTFLYQWEPTSPVEQGIATTDRSSAIKEEPPEGRTAYWTVDTRIGNPKLVWSKKAGLAGVCLLPDGGMAIAFRGEDPGVIVEVYDSTGNLRFERSNVNGSLVTYDALFSSDRRYVAITLWGPRAENKGLWVVDLQSGREMVMRNDSWGHANEFIPCFRSNDSIVVYVHKMDRSTECEAHIIDLTSGTVREVALRLSPSSKAFSKSWNSYAGAGGNVLAVKQTEHSILRRQALMVFNLDDGREIARWYGGCTEEVAVTSDGRYVITDEFP